MDFKYSYEVFECFVERGRLRLGGVEVWVCYCFICIGNMKCWVCGECLRVEFIIVLIVIENDWLNEFCEK